MTNAVRIDARTGQRTTVTVDNPAPPAAELNRPPSEITFRQLVLGMLAAELISGQEADDWSADRNAFPAIISAIIDALPSRQRLPALITARTMTTVERTNALIAAAAAVQLPDASQEERDAARDAYFAAWAQI